MQALRDLEPLVRRVAGAAHRSMPASADLDDVRQVAWIAGWQALLAFRGGAFEAFAAERMRRRIIDWQRQQRPGGRSAAPFDFVGDDALDGIPAAPDALWGGDPAVQYERRQMAMVRLHRLSRSERAVTHRVLSGQSRVAGVDSVVAKMQRDLDSKPATLAGIVIRKGSMPPPRELKRDGLRGLVAEMAPTDSVCVTPKMAEAIRKVMSAGGIASMTFKHSPTEVEIWREPSPEQRAARKARATP
jgi:DNA-directed RNA polymerase specialized sigma24 family protein